MISIVSSKGTFIKSDTTSNDHFVFRRNRHFLELFCECLIILDSILQFIQQLHKKQLRFMLSKRYMIFHHINYQKKSMKHYHIVWIVTFLQKLQDIGLVQNLKCSFKICLRTYQQSLGRIQQESKRNWNQLRKRTIK